VKAVRPAAPGNLKNELRKIPIEGLSRCEGLDSSSISITALANKQFGISFCISDIDECKTMFQSAYRRTVIAD
jgi:hypothetical protein